MRAIRFETCKSIPRHSGIVNAVAGVYVSNDDSAGRRRATGDQAILGTLPTGSPFWPPGRACSVVVGSPLASEPPLSNKLVCACLANAVMPGVRQLVTNHPQNITVGMAVKPRRVQPD